MGKAQYDILGERVNKKRCILFCMIQSMWHGNDPNLGTVPRVPWGDNGKKPLKRGERPCSPQDFLIGGFVPQCWKCSCQVRLMGDKINIM